MTPWSRTLRACTSRIGKSTTKRPRSGPQSRLPPISIPAPRVHVVFQLHCTHTRGWLAGTPCRPNRSNHVILQCLLPSFPCAFPLVTRPVERLCFRWNTSHPHLSSACPSPLFRQHPAIFLPLRHGWFAASSRTSSGQSGCLLGHAAANSGSSQSAAFTRTIVGYLPMSTLKLPHPPRPAHPVVKEILYTQELAPSKTASPTHRLAL